MKQLLEELFSRYHKEVYSYVYSLCRDTALAEDLVSETFLEAVKSIPSFRGDADIRTWLFSIARHRWYHYLRQKNTRPETVLLGDFLPDTAPSPEATVTHRLLLERILQLLDGESERARSIVRMRLQGYSFYEIGKAHGISESSARVIDFRTRTKLRSTLQKEGLTYD